MRQMFIDYAQTSEGAEIDIIVLDTDDLQYSRDKREYINMNRAVEDVLSVVTNTNVDVIYADKSGVGDIFINILDSELFLRQIETPIKPIKQLPFQVLYLPKGESEHGHQTDCTFRI